MAKPVCKSEASWKYWREDIYGPMGLIKDKFTKWSKHQMVRARRRFFKEETRKVSDRLSGSVVKD